MVTVKELKEEAKKLGIPGYYKLSKPALISEIELKKSSIQGRSTVTKVKSPTRGRPTVIEVKKSPTRGRPTVIEVKKSPTRGRPKKETVIEVKKSLTRGRPKKETVIEVKKSLTRGRPKKETVIEVKKSLTRGRPKKETKFRDRHLDFTYDVFENAVFRGDISTLKKMDNKINFNPEYKYVILSSVVEKGYDEILDELLANWSFVRKDLLDINEDTDKNILMIAIETCYIPTIEILKKYIKESDLYITNSEGRSAFSYEEECGDEEVKDILKTFN
jgi:hypothetical protein